MLDFGNATFRAEILEAKEKVQQYAAEPLLDSIPFKSLRALFISEMAKGTSVDLKSIHISTNDFKQLPEVLDEQVKKLFASDEFIKNRHIEVDSQLNVTATYNEEFAEDSTTVINMYIEISLKEKIIFLLSRDDGLSYFIKGHKHGEGIFATNKDWALYKKKKTVDEIDQVFEEYRDNHLTDSNNYQKFFVSLTQLRSLHMDMKSELSEKDFIAKYKNLVKNKPESYFRDDLLGYLQAVMRAEVAKEFTLNDDDRIDILVHDEAGLGLYFIEVKWIGTSIDRMGKNIGSTFEPNPNVVPKGYRQTVRYIKELSDIYDNVKLGYLVVFDAREGVFAGDSGDTRSSDMLDEQYKRYERQFRKVADFRVENIKPR